MCVYKMLELNAKKAVLLTDFLHLFFFFFSNKWWIRCISFLKKGL